MSDLPTAAQLWSCCLTFTIFFSMWAGCCCFTTGEKEAVSFEMRMIYRYSDEFREHVKGRPGMQHMVSDWPKHGTVDFYHELARHDRHRHASRSLLAADVYSLLPSNTTLFSPTMGGLHYSFILLGTPAKAFLVALDTGSDLLWVPCDCQQCSAANWTTYGVNVKGLEFAIYSPSNSTTSKPVACNDVACDSTLSPGVCDISAPQSCTYSARYVSANTSSSGTIVQDLIYMSSETSGSKFSSEIYLGCGKLQTGGFLDGGAPNGLFGLGPEIYSVPSTFARNGIIKNVFSMCFSLQNRSGTLVFGRKAGASLQSTPIIPITPNVYYVLEIEAFIAAGKRVNGTHSVVFDTGTSLTIFPSSMVKSIGDALSSAASLKPFQFSTDTIVLDYCWNVTTEAEIDTLSSLSFVFGGGGLWTINGALVPVTDESGNLVFICLGILSANSSSATPIIGFNFMGDYEYFFDQEASTFSWSPSNCSGTSGTSTLGPSIAPAPAPAPAESAPAPSKEANAPKSSRPPPPPPARNSVPPPPPSSPSNVASSILFQPTSLVLLISLTFFIVLSK